MAIQCEVFMQSPNVRIDAIRVSLNKRGLFSLNQKAFESLQKTEKVELLFAKDNKLIGMRPCALEAKNGHKLAKQGRANSYIVRGRAYCNTYGLKPKATVVFEEPKVDEDGVLVIEFEESRRDSQAQPESKTDCKSI